MFLPKKIKAGYNEREDCYTGKLSYIIYYDEKDKLRKEASWNSWKDDKLGSDDYTNEPTEGFVLNKKAGGQRCSWNTRNTYTRVYDPRGFEFEISIPNLIFILENANSYKGKALEGDFVYGWEGTELWLVPVGAPEYAEWTNTSKILLSNTTIKAKDLVAGYTYMTKQAQSWIYLGRFIEYGKLKKHWFVNVNQTEEGEDKEERSSWSKNYYEDFTSLYASTITSVPQKIVYCISEEVHPEYPELMEALEHKSSYVGSEETTKTKPYTYTDLSRECIFNKDYHYNYSESFFDSEGILFYVRFILKEEKFEKYRKVNKNTTHSYYNNYDEVAVATYDTIEELFNNGDCNYQNYYLSNGKICRTSRTYDISLKEIIMEEENNE
jgi:hypothetical protein